MHRGVTTLLIALCLLAGGAAWAAYWDVDQVYSGRFGSGDTSLAVSEANVPSISYTANGNVYTATETVGGWSSEPVASAGFWGGYTSLAFSPGGQLCLAFIDGTGATNYVKYAYKSGASWTVESVDDVGWKPDYVSLAFNQKGEACIAYCKTTGSYPDTRSYVCFARRTSVNTWTCRSVVEVAAVTGPSLAIGADDAAYMTFADSGTGQLRLATGPSADPLQVRTLDGSPAGKVVWYTSVTLGPDGSPAVAYFQNSAGSVLLKYARRAGAAWTLEPVTTLASGGSYYCSTAITPGGMPLIAYYDPATTYFSGAWKSGGQWLTEVVDPSPKTGRRPCLRPDSLGNIDASYFDAAEGNVRFARAVAPQTVREVKGLPDGQTVQLSGVVASTAQGDLGASIYVQEPGRTSGIRLQFPSEVPTVARGMMLDVQGQLTTISGERAIYDPFLVEMGP